MLLPFPARNPQRESSSDGSWLREAEKVLSEDARCTSTSEIGGRAGSEVPDAVVKNGRSIVRIVWELLDALAKCQLSEAEDNADCEPLDAASSNVST